LSSKINYIFIGKVTITLRTFLSRSASLSLSLFYPHLELPSGGGWQVEN